MKRLAFLVVLSSLGLCAQNPIVPNRGLNDPHIHIFNDTAYVYATHDKAAANTQFVMEDWWIWSSPDLVNWTHRSTLDPADTYIGGDFGGCWATDVGHHNGKYYWYFSEKNQQTGVAVGPSPVGPWRDALGKPLLTEDLTPTDEYDMAIFAEDGKHYILFGVWDYYLAELGDDMISLAEAPRKVEFDRLVGPYGEGKTDDKPYLHKYGDTYYLSWGAFYATAPNLYGPYTYRGTVMEASSFAPGYDTPTWPHGFLQGRHGSFFEWHGQWYFTYCDMSQTGNRRFRDAFISYVHYRDDGTIAPVRVDGIGVGWHPISQGIIPAEEYFVREGFRKEEDTQTGFRMVLDSERGHLYFPKLRGTTGVRELTLKVGAPRAGDYRVSILRGQGGEEEITQAAFSLSATETGYGFVTLPLPRLGAEEDLRIEFSGQPGLRFDGFTLH